MSILTHLDRYDLAGIAATISVVVMAVVAVAI